MNDQASSIKSQTSPKYQGCNDPNLASGLAPVLRIRIRCFEIV
jgi:hypothetical protein